MKKLVQHTTKLQICYQLNLLTTILLLFLIIAFHSCKDVCADIACGENAICNTETGQCECLEGWEGDNCEVLIGDCTINPCVNGDCDETTGLCDCPDDFWGSLCEKEVITFEKQITGQIGGSVIQTSDGGYLIQGRSDDKILLTKTNVNGDEEWSITFPNNTSILNLTGAAIETLDGHYVVCGSVEPENYWKKYAFLAKVNMEGQVIWSHFYEELNNIQYINDLVESSDGGYLLVGNSYPHIDFGGESDVYLLKTNIDGQKEWSKTIGLNQYDEGVSVDIDDNGYVIVGSSYSIDNSCDPVSIFLLKITESGVEEWHTLFGCEGRSEGFAVQKTMDGGYMAFGKTFMAGNSSDLFLIKTDELGAEQWSATFGGEGVEQGYSARQTEDGGYILCGSESVYLVKTDANGIKEWSKTFDDGPGTDYGIDIKQTLDGGFIITGSHLIKTNRIGEL